MSRLRNMKDDQGSDIGHAGIHRWMYLSPRYLILPEHLLSPKYSSVFGLASWRNEIPPTGCKRHYFLQKNSSLKLVKKVKFNCVNFKDFVGLIQLFMNQAAANLERSSKSCKKWKAFFIGKREQEKKVTLYKKSELVIYKVTFL